MNVGRRWEHAIYFVKLVHSQALEIQNADLVAS